jgi:hypothetical protein
MSSSDLFVVFGPLLALVAVMIVAFALSPVGDR